MKPTLGHLQAESSQLIHDVITNVTITISTTRKRILVKLRLIKYTKKQDSLPFLLMNSLQTSQSKDTSQDAGL